MRRAMSSQPYSPSAAAREAAAIRSSRAGSPSSEVKRAGQGLGVARVDELRRAGGRHLREPADAREQHRLAERQRREQHAALVDLAVREHDQRRRAERARQLAGRDEPQRGAHVAPVHGAHVHPRHADDPQLGVDVRLRPGLQQHVHALVGPQEAEHQHHRPVRHRERRLPGHVEPGQRPVADDVDQRRIKPQLVPQPRRAVLGVHDDRVHPLVEPALRLELAGLGLTREHVVRGQQPRVPARQQPPVDLLHRQPLEVHDVRSRVLGTAACRARAGRGARTVVPAPAPSDRRPRRRPPRARPARRRT